jgi:Fur family peroxide stress response transcriptional regulator
MDNYLEYIRNRLVSKGLKVTPQRVLVFESLLRSKDHPTADEVTSYIRNTNPNISRGTIYNILDTLVESELIVRVKTDKDKMRYDAVLDKHHHIYDLDSDRIVDFYDEELDKIIRNYLDNKQIPEFDMLDFKLHILGRHKD